MERLIDMIKQQQVGHVNDDVFMVGEQLKDMASREPAIVDILKDDLTVESMNIKNAAAKIKEYADKNKGRANCFCVTPIVAESILREFYGLGKVEQIPVQPQPVAPSVQKIDLSDFL